MKQGYRWDVTGALNIVKFRSRFASNKRQIQRMSTILRANGALRSPCKPNRQPLHPAIGLEEFTHSMLWVSRKFKSLE